MSGNYDLEGKVAIVTGAGKGIGKAIALAYAKAGADVVVAARTEKQIQQTAEDIRGFGRRSLAIAANMSKKSDVDNMVQKVIEEFGVIHIHVNNAGIMIKAPILDMPEKDWDLLFDIDLKGYFLCAQAVGKRMVKQGYGNIINMTSQYAYRVTPGMGAYSVAKTGIVMLTRVLARELASFGIRSNAIAPGIVRTDFSKPSWNKPELLKQQNESIPLGRIGECSDLVGAALFLASDASNYITGITIPIEGGSIA